MYTIANSNKKPTIFSPRTARKQGKHGELVRDRNCCFGTFMKMGSSTSQPTQQNQQAKAKVEQEEEEERQREKSRKINGKGTMEKAQNPPSPSYHLTCTPPLADHKIQLAALVNQAKAGGWYIEPHEIELQELVAEGSTALVYKATWRGLDVAVKCIYPEHFLEKENTVFFFMQELETLSRQRHRSVLQLIGACLRPPEHGWLVTEFLSMTLKDWLHGSRERREGRTTPLPPFWQRLSKAREIAEAMRYLHEQRPMVIHRDLKPSNIFLDDAMRVRVADFGNARFLCPEEMAISGETGTYVYMAPEVISYQPYNEKCDVFSFGIILNELITGEFPYVETPYTPYEIASAVCGEEKLRPVLPKENGAIVKELVDLINLSWNENPSLRPSFTKLASSLRMIQTKQFEAIPI